MQIARLQPHLTSRFCVCKSIVQQPAGFLHNVWDRPASPCCWSCCAAAPLALYLHTPLMRDLGCPWAWRYQPASAWSITHCSLLTRSMLALLRSLILFWVPQSGRHMAEVQVVAAAPQLTAGSAEQCVLAFRRRVQRHHQLVLQQWQAHGAGPSESEHCVQCPLQVPKGCPLRQ